MKPLQTDLSIYGNFHFEHSPVAVKFQHFKPENVEPLAPERSFSLCEMLREAGRAEDPFYFGPGHEETCVGRILLGMQAMEPFAESGQIGEHLGVFEEARANYALYRHVPRFDRDVVRYVVFSRLDRADFDPDVTVFAANPSQAEILLRATTFSTGEPYASRVTPVMGCAWALIYPFQRGRVNHFLPEFVHGMKGRGLYPRDTVLVTVPHQWLPTVTANLGRMTWHLPSHRSRDAYLEEFGGILSDLSRRAGEA
jgi:uncharacterized protein (DUF169 family)